MIEDQVNMIRHHPFKVVSPTITIRDAMSTMVDLDIACLMISEDERLVGLFSERDVLMKVAHQFDKIKDHLLREVMTTDPLVAYETDSPAKVLNIMAVGGIRHVPILNLEEQIVGILGPRRVTAYLKNHLPKD